MKPGHINLTGQRFGRLTVRPLWTRRPRRGDPSRSNIWWFCVCDCSVEKWVRADRLMSGETRSCACLVKNRPSKRGIYKKRQDQGDPRWNWAIERGAISI